MKKMCLGLLLITSLAGASPSESTLFEKGSGFKKPLYTWKREEPAPGKTVVTYAGMDGKEVVREEAVADGEKIKCSRGILQIEEVGFYPLSISAKF